MFFSKKKKENPAPATNSLSQPNHPPTDILEIVRALITSFEQTKNEVTQKAISIRNFFNTEWDEYLDAWDVERPTSADREDALKRGTVFTHGALPMEVREVFIAVKEKYESKSELLRSSYKQELFDHEEAEELLWNFEHRTLHAFVEENTKQYIKQVKKSANDSMSNIFNNAGQNQNKWSNNLNDAKSYMIRCKNCGAARVHTEQYDKCKFCGSELFEKIEQ